jgi:hypothetical protein
MSLRILRYQIAIIQKHLDEVVANKDDAKNSIIPLPLVVPLVFYNGVQ